MSFILRPYQVKAEQDVYEAWAAGAINVLLRMDTGAGKTVVASNLFRDHQGASCLIAHRQELVGQLSVALAMQGVHHNIIAPNKIVRFISSYHVRMCGQSFFHPQAPCSVAGVKTLVRRKEDLGQWAHQVTLWGMDEAHHVLLKNEWGVAVSLFKNARGVGFSATPGRADGKGLGRHAHGVFDAMVEGPPMRELIKMGNLTDYKIFVPPTDMDVTNIDVSKTTGDFNPNQLREASHKSHIVGDVVDQYLRIAPGKLGLTFAVDVETATEIADRYRQLGVPAEVVSAKTPDPIRAELMERFKRGELKNLVNVDLFGEGTDVPGVEVISKARPTQSYPLYAQQFGRALRPLPGKGDALIIDHVSNVIRHGLPDAPRDWSLDARERGTRGKRDETVTPVTACPQCIGVYERFLVACPYCGHRPEPAGRSRPEQVDGDLFELTPEALAQLRGGTLEAQRSADDQLADWCGENPPTQQQYMMHAQLKKKQTAAAGLVETINLWGAHSEQISGDSRQESYKRFYLRFGIDHMTAQTLGRKEAEELGAKIKDDMSQRWQA